MRDAEMIDWTNLDMELSHLGFEESDNPGCIIVRNDFFSSEIQTEDRQTAVGCVLDKWKDFNLVMKEKYIDGELVRKRPAGIVERGEPRQIPLGNLAAQLFSARRLDG